ncbi:MAG TPA: PRC-barrel domain-containing protein [Candidatus Baltobacteraceae bacterium]|nr:PRC-barrel domain-containing protein [Candidatus Baltobacteraceae bacterium]
MIKGSQLVGRAVIDMEAAERLGRIKEIIVQRDGERVAGFVVVHGETIVGTGGTRQTIPASALHSIGPDAITVRGSAMKDLSPDLDSLPRMSDVIGHKMVTRSGRLLGLIDDLLINGVDGTIIGFAVGEGIRSKLENIFNPQRSRIHGYVRADADLQVGNELIVVPDDALIEGEPSVQEGDHKQTTQKAGEAESRGWGARASSESTRSSIWTRRTDAATRRPSQTPAEARPESETAQPVENKRAAAPAEEATPEASPTARGDEAVTAAPQDQPPK